MTPEQDQAVTAAKHAFLDETYALYIQMREWKAIHGKRDMPTRVLERLIEECERAEQRWHIAIETQLRASKEGQQRWGANEAMTMQSGPGSKRTRGRRTRLFILCMLAVWMVLSGLETWLDLAGIKVSWWLLALQGVMTIIIVLVYVRWRGRQKRGESA